MAYKDLEKKKRTAKAWKDKNRERLNSWARKSYAKNPRRQISATIKYKYGITYKEYESMLEKQGGGCAICQTKDSGGRGRFHIDHDHSCCPTQKTCGKCVRGLLCSKCNTKLSVIESGWVDKGVAYLAKWK